MKRREPIRRPVPSASRPISPVEFGTPQPAVPSSPAVSRVPQRKYVSSDLKKIGIITALMFVILIVLSIVL
jgi:hypothetical protein